MKKEKYIILSVSILILILLSISIYISIKENNKNKKTNETNYNLVIYQYEVSNYNINYNSEPIIYKKMPFTKDLELDEVIISLDKNGSNHLIIKNGEVKVIDATCKNHICMTNKITLDNDFINNKEIICMPNGLVVTIENNN